MVSRPENSWEAALSELLDVDDVDEVEDVVEVLVEDEPLSPDSALSHSLKVI